MKEQEQSWYLRWGLPGWMMYLALFGFALIDITFTQNSSLNRFFINFQRLIDNTGPTSSFSTIIIGLMVAAAGIPMGFIIYQFYFFVRWNSPFSRDGLFPPLVVGRMNDLERILDDIPDSQIRNGEEWRKTWIDNSLYKTDHCEKWRYVENYFIEVIQKLDVDPKSISIHSRYRHLIDLLHILGAGLFGIYLGYLGYLMLKVKFYSQSLSTFLIICAVCLVTLIFFLEMEDRFRKKALVNAKEGKQSSFFTYANFSVMYIYLVGAFLYFGSPSVYPNTYSQEALIRRSVILAIPLLVWLLSSNKHTIGLRIVEIIAMLLLGSVAYLISQYARTIIAFDLWPFGWATYAFLITNMVFLKNRQNARDDLIAMQNYTIKRFVFAPSKPVLKAERSIDLKVRL
jgi:hypothetical protein